ncbi:EAL domain-containing protein [Paenibacillus roseipurpureus]|uniref:EAL domain-containing protein n=1 Tax=Paenibacillus roseopurpureus TaxID=2918901 RepID=A0AA96LNT9_9BACL|nr:EAL domain-containing protein [Paenibacillus sp. MBLB1832]WNR44536.1 EAL domain-containing protein [Paenibacillus sp. MBLB1832]
MFEKTKIARAIFLFLFLASIWELDTSFLYAEQYLSTTTIDALFRLFRFGPIMVTPALYYIAFSMADEVEEHLKPRWLRLLLNKVAVCLVFSWGLIVYFVGWTKQGIASLYLVQIGSYPPFLFPESGPWNWIFYSNIMLSFISLVITYTISLKITDPNKRNFLLVFSVSIAVGYIIGTMNLFQSSRLFPSAFAGLIFALMTFTAFTRMHTKIVKYMAYHDALTGLPNQRLFKSKLVDALEDAKRNGTNVAVLYMDLDRFKLINDTLGHNVGDMLLQHVAQRIKGNLNKQATASRQGGDEFTILLPDLSHEEIEMALQDLFTIFNKPFTLQDYQLYITPSIGISLYPNSGPDPDILIKNADTAMYRAKEKGKNTYQFFDETMEVEIRQKLNMENALRKALENEQFVLQYQPKVDVLTGRITGTEALIRWQHPALGFVPPSEFIPLAEETGLIIPIGKWVLSTACAQCKAWQVDEKLEMSVAVNLSMLQLRQENFIEMVEQVLMETGLDPQYLEIEITESSAMNNIELCIQRLIALKKLGVGISIDDFGTGYSSLAYLKQLPIDTLKIDRSFINDITNSEDDAAIVQAIIAMARILKLKVIAEGVETQEQLTLLEQYKCNAVQGYYLSRPLAAWDVVKRHRERMVTL